MKKVIIGIICMVGTAFIIEDCQAFNHSLRGEQLPRVYDFNKRSSQPTPKPTNVNQEPVSVSEPGTLVLLGLGLTLIALRGRK